MRASSRQQRPFQRWKWMTIGLMTLYSVATCVNATVVCHDCRLLALQEAPGTCDVPNLGKSCKNDINGSLQPLACLWHLDMGPCCPTYQIFTDQLLIDLSAASVQFVNGTTSDVALVHGGEEYLQAMIRWQQLDTIVTSTTTQSSQNG